MQRFRIYLFLQDGGFSVHHQELNIVHCQVFVRPILLPAASLGRLAAGSSIGLTNT